MRERLLFFAMLLLASLPAAALTARLDESASPRQRIDVTPRWAHDSGGELNDETINALVAEIRGKEFRLNTAPFVGKEARIYLTVSRNLPGLRSPSAMRLEWVTRGRFAAGSLLPGDRALVFQGTIREALLVEYFDFTIHIDARQLERGFEFEPVFEIDLPDR